MTDFRRPQQGQTRAAACIDMRFLHIECASGRPAERAEAEHRLFCCSTAGCRPFTGSPVTARWQTPCASAAGARQTAAGRQPPHDHRKVNTSSFGRRDLGAVALRSPSAW